MSNEQMVKIELVGHSWQEWGDFAGVKYIIIPKINLNEVAQEFTFKGKRWSYLPFDGHGYDYSYAIKINPCGENVIDKPKQFAQPRPRPEWISFKTPGGSDVVINTKHIKSMAKYGDTASVKYLGSGTFEDTFPITHETYEQIKKQLMREV